MDLFFFLQVAYFWAVVLLLVSRSWALQLFLFWVKFLTLYWALCLELCIRAGKQDMAVGNGLVSGFLLGFSFLIIQRKKKGEGGREGIKALWSCSPAFCSPDSAYTDTHSVCCPQPGSIPTPGRSSEQEVKSFLSWTVNKRKKKY